MSNPIENPTRAFLVYAPYCTDPDMENRRDAARADHLAHIGAFFQSKIIKVGGVFLEPEPAEGASPKTIGSTLIVQMDTGAEVRKMLEEDSFYKHNIWDKERLVVVPYLFVVT